MAENTPREKTRDTLFDGKIVCWQYKQGYRFSLDSVLLAHFAPVRKDDTILDLGSGCGVLGLILLYRHRNNGIHVTGIEKQFELMELARLNIDENKVADSFHLVSGDVADTRKHFAPELFSLVISNPPFYSISSGRSSNRAEPLAARHRPDDGLEVFVDGVAYCLKNRGRVVFVYPAHLLSELFSAMTARRLEPKVLQFVFSYPDGKSTAKLVLVQARKNGGNGLTIRPPLYIYQYQNGPYTEAVASMYRSEMVDH